MDFPFDDIDGMSYVLRMQSCDFFYYYPIQFLVLNHIVI